MKQDVLELFAGDEAKEQELGKAGANHSYNRPLPDPGKYDCAFADMRAFSYADDEKKAIALEFQILTGEREGLIIEQTFWEDERDVGRLFDAATVLTGQTPTTRPEAVQLLGQALQAAESGSPLTCTVEIKEYTVKKGKNAGDVRKSVQLVNA